MFLQVHLNFAHFTMFLYNCNHVEAMPILGTVFKTAHLKKEVSCSIANATLVQKAIVSIAYIRFDMTFFQINFFYTLR